MPVPRLLHTEPGVPMQLHLGGELRHDRTHTPEEPLRAYADPAGHVFCIFVA